MPRVFSSEQRLSNFVSAAKGGEEGSGTAIVTITEGLGAGVESALGRVADVEITNKKSHSIGVRGSSSSSIKKSPAEFLKGTSGW